MATYKIENVDINKVLAQILRDNPKNIDALEKIGQIARKQEYLLTNPVTFFYKVLASELWTREEKVRICKAFGFDEKINNRMHFLEETIDSYGPDGKPCKKVVDVHDEYHCHHDTFPLDFCIKHQNLSGLQAVLDMGGLTTNYSLTSYLANIKDQNLQTTMASEILGKLGTGEVDVLRASGNSEWTITRKYLLEHVIDNMGRDCVWKPILHERNPLRTILHVINNKDLVELFLKYGADAQASLNAAILTGNTKIIDALLNAGVDIDYYNDGTIISPESVTALKTAIKNNDLAMVKHLHKSGANLHFINSAVEKKSFESASTALTYCTRLKATNTDDPHYYTLSFLNGNACYNNGHGYVKEADHSKTLDVADYLIANGVLDNEGYINYTDLIRIAILAGDITRVSNYFEQATKDGIKVDFDGIIDVLFITSKFRNTELLMTIVKYAEIIDRDKNMPNVVLRFIQGTNGHVIDYLKEKINPIIKDLTTRLSDEEKRTVPACSNVDNIEQIKFLMTLGYDIRTKNKDGNDALMNYIAKNKNEGNRSNDVSTNFARDIKYLIESGSLIGELNNDGDNALSLAISRISTFGHSEVYDLDRYSNVDFRNKNYKTAIKCLIENASEEVVQSDIVRKVLEESIQPLYGQMLHQDLLSALVAKGFKVSNDYFEKVISETFNQFKFTKEKSFDPEQILNFMFANFNNNNIGELSGLSKPNFRLTTYMSAFCSDSDASFNIVKEIVKRYYITSKKQLDFENNPFLKELKAKTSEEKSSRYNDKTIDSNYYIQSALCYILSDAICRFSLKQISELFSVCPIYDINWGSTLIPYHQSISLMMIAYQKDDLELVRWLSRKGVPLQIFDREGTDVTLKYAISEKMRKFIMKYGNQRVYGELRNDEVALYEQVTGVIVNSDGKKPKSLGRQKPEQQKPEQICFEIV